MDTDLVNNMSHTNPAQMPEPVIRLNNIEKSQLDTREYRGLQLENGLKAFLVSDPTTDVAAAALAVSIGNMSDPDDLPGLAHFCEHMLFLGNEKYPVENGYALYLSENGGANNASTFPQMTKYYFNVLPDKLDEALDRFAQFFIGPLFTQSATEREIQAVHSEHEKNISNDQWRLKRIHLHLAKPDHPYSKFGSGNKSTLSEIPKQKNIDVREALLQFYKKYYSANIMSLSVIGKESLDELEQIVLEKFSQIINKNVELPSWPRQPYDEDRYAQKVLVVPVKDIRSMTLSWTTDDLSEYYKSSPESYLTHLIGHEGKGSILSELRRLGWCNDLMAGHSNTQRGFGFFEVIMWLTETGMQHVDDIANIIFQYLHLLRQEGPQKWIFDECNQINEMRFRFKDKEQPQSLVTHAVTAMQIYPLEEVLSAPYISNEWNPKLISKLLNELVPAKCRITLISQAYEEQATSTEPYYGTKYGIVKVDKATLERWENCGLNNNLSLPQPNVFIPSNFELMPHDADISKHPTIIMDTPIMRAWHKQDDVFNMPKACMAFDFSNPIAYFDPLHCNLNKMMVDMLKDQLNEYLYDAELAGLRLLVSSKSTGIGFLIKGYNDKQVVLLEKLLNHIFKIEFDEKRFDILKEESIRSHKNFNAEQPYQHAIYYLALILTETAWSHSELMDAMKLVTFERLVSYAKEFFQRIHTEIFIYGNINKKQALDVTNIVNKRFECTNSVVLPVLARQMLKKREYKLASGDSYLFEHVNEFHPTNCAELYFQCGPHTDGNSIMVSLLSQILSEPCYDVLRTKEQLGYIVLMGIRRVNGANGVRIVVQSTKHPSFVEDRIENFLSNCLQNLIDMSQEEFERHKEALALKKLEKRKTIYQQFNSYHGEISISQYHFERAEAEVALLKNINKEEFLEYFKTFIGKNGAERRVLSIHIISSQFEENSEENGAITSMERHSKITDLSAFKSSKELYPITMPYLDIRAKGARSKL